MGVMIAGLHMLHIGATARELTQERVEKLQTNLSVMPNREFLRSYLLENKSGMMQGQGPLKFLNQRGDDQGH